MPSIKLRKIGGSTVATIPPYILDELMLTAGSEVTFAVERGRPRTAGPPARVDRLAGSLQQVVRTTRLPHYIRRTVRRDRGFTVLLTGGKTTGVVLCNQMRTLDVKARRGNRIETADKAVVEQVLWKLQAILAD